MSLSASAQRVQDALMKLGLTLQVVELPDSTRSAAEAAEAMVTKTPRAILDGTPLNLPEPEKASEKQGWWRKWFVR